MQRTSSLCLPVQTVVSRIARNSYGIVGHHRWDANLHDARDKFQDRKGDWRARDQVDWVVRKGDRIATGESRSRIMLSSVQHTSMFWPVGSFEFVQRVYVCG